jgi:hypothetical protein
MLPLGSAWPVARRFQAITHSMLTAAIRQEAGRIPAKKRTNVGQTYLFRLSNHSKGFVISGQEGDEGNLLKVPFVTSAASSKAIRSK